jgi:hypothetical protein
MYLCIYTHIYMSFFSLKTNSLKINIRMLAHVCMYAYMYTSTIKAQRLIHEYPYIHAYPPTHTWTRGHTHHSVVLHAPRPGPSDCCVCMVVSTSSVCAYGCVCMYVSHAIFSGVCVCVCVYEWDACMYWGYMYTANHDLYQRMCWGHTHTHTHRRSQSRIAYLNQNIFFSRVLTTTRHAHVKATYAQKCMRICMQVYSHTGI